MRMTPTMGRAVVSNSGLVRLGGWCYRCGKAWARVVSPWGTTSSTCACGNNWERAWPNPAIAEAAYRFGGMEAVHLLERKVFNKARRGAAHAKRAQKRKKRAT